MDTSKIHNIILLVVLVATTVYSINRHSRVKELKAIHSQYHEAVDSLSVLENRYSTLYAQYRQVYNKLTATTAQLESTRQEIAGLFTSGITSLNVINTRLEHIYHGIDTTALSMDTTVILLQ